MAAILPHMSRSLRSVAKVAARHQIAQKLFIAAPIASLLHRYSLLHFYTYIQFCTLTLLHFDTALPTAGLSIANMQFRIKAIVNSPVSAKAVCKLHRLCTETKVVLLSDLPVRVSFSLLLTQFYLKQALACSDCVGRVSL